MAFLQYKNRTYRDIWGGAGQVQRVLSQAAAAIAGWAIVSSPALGGWLSPCATARLIASWKHDGLWLSSAIEDPPISIDGHRVRFVGDLRSGHRAYKIYYDDHSHSTPGSEAHDASQYLIVTTGRERFLGLYYVGDIVDIYGEPTRTVGSDILFPRGKANGAPFENRLHFGPEGPPKTVRRFFGYDLTFSTPAEILKQEPHRRHRPEQAPRVAAYCRR